MANTTIQIRTDAEVKATADLIFNKLGITISDGINIFLRQVNMYNGFPFEIKLTELKDIQDHPKQQENIHSLYGKYKSSTFSTARYLKQKNREKELDR
ncbi:MAG: type II toxin-antitoxin system RelB/DinJ family antitoxin [Treponema sp.]|nr:type II toxin-antitoxin system RelB/DinJ family antitoxin [Treponema sp.]